jgi:glycosyltransferase involved in cell wall biosynthesis
VVGDGARLVSSGDVDELSAALDALLDDSDERARLIDAGRTQASRYSWDACTEGIVNLYRRLC